MGDFLQPREANLAEALGEMQVAVNEQRERAEKAEAAIARVRALRARGNHYDAEGYGYVLLTDVLYALNGPEPNFPPVRALDGSETL